MDAKPCTWCEKPKSAHWGRELYCSAKGKEFHMGPWYEPEPDEPAHTCISNDGANPGRSCDACKTEQFKADLDAALVAGVFCRLREAAREFGLKDADHQPDVPIIRALRVARAEVETLRQQLSSRASA